MIRRASEEEQAKKRREEAEAREEEERKRLFAEAFNEQIQADAHRHQIERERHRARHRAQSDATQVPEELADDILTQSFDREIVANELHFHAVKLFHPRPGQLLLNVIFRKFMLLQIVLVLFIKRNLFAMTLLRLFRSSFIWSHSTRTITLRIKAVRSLNSFKRRSSVS
jgi:hypothetical protein